ncbi:MAG: AAA family ATPase [Bdellovibrionia bacterium]
MKNKTRGLTNPYGLVFLSSFFFIQSQDTWAETKQVSYLFRNGNRALIQVNEEDEFRFSIDLFEKGSKTSLKRIIESKGLKYVYANQIKKSSHPLSPWVRIRPGQEGFFSFRDQSRSWFFEDGSVTTACLQKEFSQSSATLIDAEEDAFLLEITRGERDSIATLLRKSDGKCLRLNSLLKGEKLDFELNPQFHLLTFPGLNQAIDLKAFKMVYSIRNGVDAYFLSEQTPSNDTYLIERARDKKILKLITNPESVNKTALSQANVSQGILSIPGCSRRIDLNEFDAEVRKSEKLKKAEAVLDDRDRPIDPSEAISGQFQDLVKQSLEYPESFTEKSNPELQRKMAQSLRSRRSLVLLGRPGTGKSSAIRAFARDVGLGKIKGIPRTTQIFDVRMASLASGTKYTGMIEKRVATLIAAAKETGCLYFIDELHSMSGVGTSSHHENDITQSFKGPIESGELTLIGTDTQSEFFNAFGRDPAFIERFDQLQVEPEQGSALVELIAARLNPELSTPLDTALIQTAIDLSNEYDVTASQPRSAVNLLIKARAILEEAEHPTATLTAETLHQAAKDRYHLSSHQMDRALMQKNVLELKSGLDQQILAQEGAKRALCSIWKRKLTGVGDPNHVGSLLLVGPPGVGKSHLAELSADLMGYKKTFVEMNQFQRGDIDEFRREIYNALMKNPFQVLILDEIEKAHISVQDAALKMLQDGTFTVHEKLSGGGLLTKTVIAQKALFVLTSNAGADFIESKSQKGEEISPGELVEVLAEGGISKPILSRILHTVVLTRPSEEEFQHAVRFYLSKTLERESQKHRVQFQLTNSEEFLKHIFSEYATGVDYRHAKKSIFPIEERIADRMLGNPLEPGTVVPIQWEPEVIHPQKKRKIEPWMSMYN